MSIPIATLINNNELEESNINSYAINLLGKFTNPGKCMFEITKFREIIPIYSDMIEGSNLELSIMMYSNRRFKYYDLGEIISRGCEDINQFLRRCELSFRNYKNNSDVFGILNLTCLFTSFLIILNKENKELIAELTRYRRDLGSPSENKTLYFIGRISSFKRVKDSKVVMKRAMRDGKFRRFTCVIDNSISRPITHPVISPTF